MDFRLLGPVEAWHDDEKVDLGRANLAKVRCVLAVLLRTPGVAVTTETLTERVWGERPPGREVRYKYVGWLRSALAPYGIEVLQRDDGYLLNVTPEQVDLHRFRRLVQAARTVANNHPAQASDLLREALALWHGPALGGVSGEWARLFADQLNRERRDAAVTRFTLDLRLVDPQRLIPELTEWETDHPLDEEIVGLLMTALYRTGRRDEALRCFRRADKRLRAAQDCGPGQELLALYHHIQTRDPGPYPRAQDPGPPNGEQPGEHDSEQPGEEGGERGDRQGDNHGGAGSSGVAAGASSASRTRVVPPHQLPPAPRHFAGRSRETGTLTDLLERAEPHPGAVMIVTIHGQAGIGKTALALSWAHQVADRFPDGQLFLNLRGYDPSRAPVQPEEAISDLLDGLGAPADARPTSLDAQVSLLRSLLAGRRVLVYLDNARDVEQVRPLLPASSSCLVVITSRNQLRGLVANEGAHALGVNLLTNDGAHELLARHLGAARVDAEPAAVAQLIDQCGRLPLALAIVAARAGENPDFPLAGLARDLADPVNRLAALEGGDVTAEVRAAFSWSYQGLTPAGQRMFRLLSTHPGASCTSYAAASIADLAMEQTRQVLSELTRTHMLEQTTPGEYEYHDLLHSYAGELSRSVDSAVDRGAALHRMLDHYVRTAASAAALLNTVREPVVLLQLQPGTLPQLLDDHDQALDWFRAKRSTLIMAVRLAAERGYTSHAGDLSWALADFLDRQGHWGDLILTQSIVYEHAERLGDHEVQARASRLLGRANTQLGAFAAAQEHYQRACQLYVESSDRAGEALAHLNLAYLEERQDRLDVALAHASRALELYRSDGHRVGQARALNSVGWYHAMLGNPKRALELCSDALAVSRELTDRHGEADALDSLGYAYRHAGEPEQAIRCYQEAIALYRQLGSRFAEAATLEYLGAVYIAQGQPDTAREVLSRALDILRQLAVPGVDRIQAALDELGPPAPVTAVPELC